MLYVLHGDPQAMARPRFGKGRVYDAQSNLKLVLCIDLRNQHGKLPTYKGALELQCVFYIDIPARFGKRHRLSHVNTGCIARPDLDNYLKMLCDCSQQAGLFADDAQICRIYAQKLYCDKDSRTEFSICEIL